MKISKTASGKTQIKISEKEWTAIGKKAGWFSDKNEIPDPQDPKDFNNTNRSWDDRDANKLDLLDENDYMIEKKYHGEKEVQMLATYFKRLLKSLDLYHIHAPWEHPEEYKAYPEFNIDAKMQKFNAARSQLVARYDESTVNAALGTIKSSISFDPEFAWIWEESRRNKNVDPMELEKTMWKK